MQEAPEYQGSFGGWGHAAEGPDAAQGHAGKGPGEKNKLLNRLQDLPFTAEHVEVPEGFPVEPVSGPQEFLDNFREHVKWYFSEAPELIDEYERVWAEGRCTGALYEGPRREP